MVTDYGAESYRQQIHQRYLSCEAAARENIFDQDFQKQDERYAGGGRAEETAQGRVNIHAEPEWLDVQERNPNTFDNTRLRQKSYYEKVRSC